MTVELSCFQMSLVNTIDNSVHNDLVINLSDGTIKVSKLVLAAGSDYFMAMLSKNYQENEKNIVTFSRKTKIMRIVIEHIYGTKLKVTGLSCGDLFELLNMLRLLLLPSTFQDIEALFKKQLREHEYPLEQCIDVIEIALRLKLDNCKSYICAHFAKNISSLMSPAYSEKLKNLPVDILIETLGYIQEIEKKIKFPLPPKEQIKKLNFALLWLHDKAVLSKQIQKEILSYFDLNSFSVSQLLHEVKQTQLFQDENIYQAVEFVNNSILNENHRLKDKLGINYHL